MMITGRRRETRAALISQAALVWGLDSVDIAEFVRCGAIGKPAKRPLHPDLQAAVDKKISEYMATGKLIID
jgi:hypothetical protein